MAEKPTKWAYVVASQGHRRRFLGDTSFQPWVENVNKLLDAHGFRITVLGSGDHSGIYYSNNGKIRVIIQKKIGLLNDYFSIFLSFLMLVSRKPTIVITHGLQHYLTLIALTCFGVLKKVPFIIIVHGIYEINHPIELLRDKSIKYLLKLISRMHIPSLLVSLTNYDKRNLVKRWRLGDAKIVVSPFPLFISLDEIKAISRVRSSYTSEPRNQRSFLYLGRLSEEKGIDKIVMALKALLKEGYLARLTIIGDGPTEQSIASLVKKHRMRKVVNMQGIVVGDKKWDYYVACDVFVLASKHEGLPRVIIEAFLAGRSLIVPDICGLSEVITDGVNGFLFRNQEELVQCMIRTVEEVDLIKSMGETNRKILMDRMILETNGSEDFSRILVELGV